MRPSFKGSAFLGTPPTGVVTPDDLQRILGILTTPQNKLKQRERDLKADWVYTEEYYTVSRGVISRIVEKHNLAFIRGIPWPLTYLLRYIKPNKNGYTHWILK